MVATVNSSAGLAVAGQVVYQDAVRRNVIGDVHAGHSQRTNETPGCAPGACALGSTRAGPCLERVTNARIGLLNFRRRQSDVSNIRPRCAAGTVLHLCINDALAGWRRPRPFNQARCNRPARWRARRTWRRRSQRAQQVARGHRSRSRPSRRANAVRRPHARLHAPVGVCHAQAVVRRFQPRNDVGSGPSVAGKPPLEIVILDPLPAVAIRQFPRPIHNQRTARRSRQRRGCTRRGIRRRRGWCHVCYIGVALASLLNVPNPCELRART